MSKELKVKEETNVAVAQGSFGVADNIDSRDITVPNINIGQAISNAVKKGEVKYGEIYDSVSNTVLAEVGKKLEVIFVKMEKVLFVTSGEKGNKFERIEQYYDGYLYTEEMNGVKYHRSLMYKYFCILAEDIKNGMPFPFVLSLMKSNMGTAKKLNTVFSRMKMANKSSLDFVFEVSGEEQGSDNGTFYVFDVRQARPVNETEKNAAVEICKFMNQNTLNVDDGVETIEATTKKPTTGNPEDDIMF